MRNHLLRKRVPTLALVVLLTAVTTACFAPAPKTNSSTWNPKAAAAYLDYRANWWSGWNGAARDHGTFCISCHTALPYALARPALHNALAEAMPSIEEQGMIDDVRKRVHLWNEIGPYYTDSGYDHKTAESRGTESVLNALILSSYDSRQEQLSEDARSALQNMWALQQPGGAWNWLQFDQEPWEANDSGYFGAALAAIAVGTAPGSYQATPGIQSNLKLLRDYLIREGANQSTMNRICLLWASTKLPGLLDREHQLAIIKEVLSRQQKDGGWRLASIAWRWNGWSVKTLLKMWLREDGTPLPGKSDGVATGLITFVLQEAGVPRDNPQLQRGISWLKSNQDPDGGFWPASSVNKKKNPASDTGRFMSDAATAYSVLALTDSQRNAASVATVHRP